MDGLSTARIAGAPISWGVCEAPGWGYELPPSVVLAEMAGLGLTATELGPTGYLGAGPAEVRAALGSHGLTLVGGFLPVRLHVERTADLTEAVAAMRTLAAAGAEVVVLAADAGPEGYDRKVALTGDEWANLLGNLHRVRERAGELGLRVSLHPHVGTAIETREAVLRLLDDSDVPLCLDTGHLTIGGMDPGELVRDVPDRVSHVHLKDVRRTVADAVAHGTTSFLEGVRGGLFAPLGHGDVDIAGVVAGLERAGYSGWYVLEQDTALSGPPKPDEGPVEDVRASLEFLGRLAVPPTS